MKYRGLVFSLLVLFSLVASSQVIDTIELAETKENSKLRQGTQTRYNVNISISDSTDLDRIDSLINRLDSIIKDVNPRSDVYGHNLFEGDSLRAYRPGDIASVPEEYVLSAGDEISISIFGASQYDGVFTIDNSGSIRPDGLPRILLKGLTWREGKQLLKRRFGSYYAFRSEQMAATVTRPRMITVNVLGEVNYPGSYKLEATNTAFNALIAAGGLTSKGSVRNIKVVQGTNSKRLDLYALINDPASQFDFYLEDNVIIQVPSIQKVVSINGAAQRPMKYELLESEGLVELIEYAGGLRGDAVTSVVQVQRNSNDRLNLLDINLDDLLNQRSNYQLEKGDEVFIKSISTVLDEIVIIEGAVQLPGNYSLTSTSRISDLLTKSKLKKEALLESAFLLRLNQDSTYRLIQINLDEIQKSPVSAVDLELHSGDKVVVPSQSTYIDKLSISITGGVRTPFEESFEESITINQAILLAGGLKSDAAEFGYVIRTNSSNRNEKEYIKVNILEAARNPNSGSNLKLFPLDELKVLISTAASDDEIVSIRGAVRSPGSYPYDQSLGIVDLLILSDGFLPEASQQVEIYRIQTDENNPTKIITTTLQVNRDFEIVGGDEDFQLQPDDEVVVRTYAAFEKQRFVELRGEVAHPGTYALIKENESIASVVQRAGGFTTQAFNEGLYLMRGKTEDYSISQENSLDFDPLRYKVVVENSALGNQILQKNDILYVPKLENEIYINVANTRASKLYPNVNGDEVRMGIPFTPNKSAKWYINNYAGGFGEDARRSSVTVMQPNGAVLRTGGFIFRKFPKVKRGSIISIDANRIDHLKRAKEEARTNKGVIINLGEKGSTEVKSIENE